MTDLFAQIAVLDRAGMVGDEPFIAETSACVRPSGCAAGSTKTERNDDDRAFRIARAAYGRTRYHHTV